MAHLTTTAEVVQALGGTAKVARRMGRTMTVVSNWKGFATFPPNTYVALSAALFEAGHTAPPSLWGMVGPLDRLPSPAAAEGARA